ncbi:hypothetical protein [Flavobacterium sp. SORGH_AS_0622]|uniref:hypothetical protein n=1 Tax=Flavobacterium sp. SORGH_AS_0622 TaxID=3041772 RepID=UPI00278AF6AA|nr:hypothetical protein [Flavobacterium sp. SORGH_AS_0622]MDQ1165923.1 hypothetical protein [Flavobacterium sp. SORGH_AS_0622]
MVKEKAFHDTIVIVKKDTIVKVVELVATKPVSQAPPIVQHFNDYSNIYTALATIAAFLALFISIKASNKASRDNTHQLLSGKFEEICELLSSMLAIYPALYNPYNLLEKRKTQTPAEKILRKNNFEQEWEKFISEIDLDLYYSKLNRLTILTNLYLGEKGKSSKFNRLNRLKILADFLKHRKLSVEYNKFAEREKELKFSTLFFIEICNILLNVARHKDLKDNSFDGQIPKPPIISILVRSICARISEKIDLGMNTADYQSFRKPFYEDIIRQQNLNKR